LEAVKVEVLLQLSTSVAVGVEGTVLGAVVPVPGRLIQPFTVRVTLSITAAVTVIEEVVAPVFQSNAPAAVVVNTEFPQLLATVTAGVVGVVFSTAVPVPAALVHTVKLDVTL
jgi:hypothetical protein